MKIKDNLEKELLELISKYADETDIGLINFDYKTKIINGDVLTDVLLTFTRRTEI